MKISKAPNFICIGPEKTGTTLLYSLLQRHPDVRLPPMKELRYWDEGYNVPTHSIGRVLTSKHWHYQLIRRRFFKKALQEFKRLVAFRWQSETEFYWWLRYVWGRRDSKWYESLFDEEFVSGDISPLYYGLPECRVRDIANYNPDMKVIMFVRDPIERAWSKIKMNLLSHKKRQLCELSFSEFSEYSAIVHGKWVPYTKAEELWGGYFKNIHIALFDCLEEDQSVWIERIYEFLELEPPVKAEGLEEKVNVSRISTIPTEFLEVLKKQYLGEIIEIEERFPNINWSHKYG